MALLLVGVAALLRVAVLLIRLRERDSAGTAPQDAPGEAHSAAAHAAPRAALRVGHAHLAVPFALALLLVGVAALLRVAVLLIRLRERGSAGTAPQDAPGEA